MAYANNTVLAVVQRAKKLVDMSKFSDAEILFEQALQNSSCSEADRMIIKYEFGTCLTLAGKIIRALCHVSDAHAFAVGKKEHEYLAFSALQRKLNILQKLHKIETKLPHDNHHRVFDLIEQGLQWLTDINREVWKSGLLLSKAEMLFSTGKKEAALEVAQESYSLAQADGIGFYLGDHCRKVAKYARELGNAEYALQVLDEIPGARALLSPMCEAKLLRERVQALHAQGPSRTAEALSIARRMICYAPKIQGNKNRFFLYAVLAETALSAHLYDEAQAAFGRARQLVLEDNTYYRFFLLRTATSIFREMKNRLRRRKNNHALKALRTALDGYIDEIDKALEDASAY